MGTAGKAVAFCGITVLVSLSTVLLVPSPAFRGVALGIMLSVVAVLAATLTLLPAVLGKARHPHRRGPAIRRGRSRAKARPAARSPSRMERMLHRWGAVLHRRPWLAGAWCSSCWRCWPGRCIGAAHRHAQHLDHPADPDRPCRLHPAG